MSKQLQEDYVQARKVYTNGVFLDQVIIHDCDYPFFMISLVRINDTMDVLGLSGHHECFRTFRT